MIVLNDAEVNEGLNETSIGQSSSFGTSAQASVQDVLIRSPVASIFRWAWLAGHDNPIANMNRMTEKEWQESEYYRPGLSFPKGVNPEVAKIVADRKDAEITRQQTIARGPKGALPALGTLALNFVGAALDPLNVASAFIPVVGQARFLRMAERVGVTPARLGRGAIEGAVGAAVVEPLVLGAAMAEQADYDFNDSLMAVAFGTVFGGGLHAIGGKIADVVRGYSPLTRQKILEGAIADGVQGKVVRADIRAKVGEKAQTDPVLNTVLDKQARLDTINEIRELFKTPEGHLPDSEIIARIDDILVKDKADLSPIEQKILDKFEENGELDQLREVMRKPVEQRTEADKAIEDTYRDTSPEAIQRAKTEVATKQAELDKAKARRPRSEKAQKQKNTTVKRLEKEVGEATAKLAEIESAAREFETVGEFKDLDELYAALEAHNKPTADAMYNPKTTEAVDEFIANKKELDQQMADIENQLAELEERGLISKEDRAVLQQAELDIKNAEKTRGITETLAICAIRTPS